jgi:hypothetical protein
MLRDAGLTPVNGRGDQLELVKTSTVAVLQK